MTSATLSDRRFRLLAWTLLGILGWLAVLAVGASLWLAEPRAAGFDWALIVEAGGRVAAGSSPYDPALLVGPDGLAAVDLFYSYPPPVAQAAAALAGVPLLASLLLLDVVAVAGAVAVAMTLAGWRGLSSGEVGLATLAILPLLLPFSLALIFGNVDVLYPLIYGAILVAAMASSRAAAVAGGIALAGGAIAKIGPFGIGLWLLVRGLRDRRAGLPAQTWRILAAAVATAAVAILASLIVGGSGPWLDYGRTLQVASGADVLVRANIAPAAQVALAIGLDAPTARLLWLAVAAIAAVVTVAAAWSISDTLLSLAIASTASLVLLPIAWYHYPPALIPFAIAAVLRAVGTPTGRTTALIIAVAGLAASAAIALPVLVWVGVGLVLVAIRTSGSSSGGATRSISEAATAAA